MMKASQMRQISILR